MSTQIAARVVLINKLILEMCISFLAVFCPHTHKGSFENTSSHLKLPARKKGWTADFTLISLDLN